MNHEAMTAIASLVSLLGLWILLFWFYRDYSIDKVRQEMFALRDQLFDEAEAGLIPFDHAAYGLLRSTMNGFIRFAHKLTLPDLLVLGVVDRFSGDEMSAEQSFSIRFEAAIADLPSEVTTRLNTFQWRMNTILVKHLARSSPIIMLTVIVPLLSWVALRFCLRQVMTILRRQIDRLDTTAFAVGQ
jgi:hypothetical protein